MLKVRMEECAGSVILFQVLEQDPMLAEACRNYTTSNGITIGIDKGPGIELNGICLRGDNNNIDFSLRQIKCSSSVDVQMLMNKYMTALHEYVDYCKKQLAINEVEIKEHNTYLFD